VKPSFERKRTAVALLCAGAALVLQACGGGGGSDGGSAPPASGSASPSGPDTSAGNSGSVSAQYVLSPDRGQHHLVGVGSQRLGRISEIAQNGASGAILKINESELSGQAVVQNISGSEAFALGRWVAGTVTTSSGAETLTGKDNRSYHYVVFNAPSAYPQSGSFSCDAGTFSTPTRVSGSSSAPATGSTSGQASLSFAADGATVAGSLTMTAGSGKGSVPLKTSGLDPRQNSITGSYFSGGAGAAVQVADGGNGTFQVVGSYRATTPDGAGYIGVFRFACK